MTRELKEEINNKHMANGVNIIYSDNTFIDAEVEIEPHVTIMPGCILQGKTKIGSGCVIGPNTRILNTKVGKDNTIDTSVIVDAVIGNSCDIGPFSYIRPNSIIGNNVRIGDFVEIKNSVIGDNTKASHLTYVGDSDVGENVNFGCGTVTVNYDGVKKHRTKIENNAFIGCNTNLVAPVTVRKEAYIAAGSTITDEVPENNLAIARTRQINKNSWRRKQ